jgi:hypothetical protein
MSWKELVEADVSSPSSEPEPLVYSVQKCPLEAGYPVGHLKSRNSLHRFPAARHPEMVFVRETEQRRRERNDA